MTRSRGDDLLQRNVAALTVVPAANRGAKKKIKPWTLAKVQQFLEVNREDPLFVAYLIVVCYGLRRGEVLGLS